VRPRPRARAAAALAVPALAVAAVAACHCGQTLPETLFDCRDAGWDCAWCSHDGACILLLDGGDPGAADAGQGGGACAPFIGQRICSVDGGVCWEHPLPQGNDLMGVWGTASSGPGASVWAVGTAGTILHWNGSAWSKVESGTRRDLLSVWSERLDEAWVTGTGGTWFKVSLQSGVAPVSSTATNDLLDVWGDPGGTALWAVGYGGKVFRLDRTLTLPAADLSGTNPNIALYAVFGVAGSSTVWVAGANGALYGYPSTGGPGVPTGASLPYDLFDLWMPNAAEVDVSTKDGGVQSSNPPGAWTAASIPQPVGDFALALWGNAATGERWVRGFDGLSYYRSPSPALTWSSTQDSTRLNFRDAWGDSSAVWSVGEKGYIGTWDAGARFDAMSFGLFPPRPTNADLLAVQSLGCEAWAGGRNGQLLHRTDAGWSQQLKTNGPITALWAGGGELWYAADAGRASQIIGGGAPQERPVPLQGQVRAFSGLATNAIWAAGEDGGVAFWGGLSWSLQPTPERVALNAVLARAPDDVWAAGDSQTVLHYDGRAWVTAMGPGPGVDLHAIAASSTQVYFAGGQTILARQEDGGWRSRSDVPAPINALAVDAAGRVWAAGAAGSLGYVPADWASPFHPVDAMARDDLNALSAAGAQLLIAGDHNAILDAPAGP